MRQKKHPRASPLTAKGQWLMAHFSVIKDPIPQCNPMRDTTKTSCISIDIFCQLLPRPNSCGAAKGSTLRADFARDGVEFEVEQSPGVLKLDYVLCSLRCGFRSQSHAARRCHLERSAWRKYLLKWDDGRAVERSRHRLYCHAESGSSHETACREQPEGCKYLRFRHTSRLI